MFQFSNQPKPYTGLLNASQQRGGMPYTPPNNGMPPMQQMPNVGLLSQPQEEGGGDSGGITDLVGSLMSMMKSGGGSDGAAPASTDTAPPAYLMHNNLAAGAAAAAPAMPMKTSSLIPSQQPQGQVPFRAPNLTAAGKFTVDPAQTLTSLGFNDAATLSQVPQIAGRIASFESGNKYGALGPVIKSGDRAYGRYQVMGNNIPSWTKSALGTSMTPQQFLSDPAAQDKVALHQMANHYKKYGNAADVASIWFSGRPARNNTSKDILGTSVPGYIKNTVAGL